MGHTGKQVKRLGLIAIAVLGLVGWIGGWEAVSAVGTVAAAVAAVWLGTREISWRADVEGRERRIVLAVVFVDLQRSASALTHALPVLKDLAGSPSGGQVSFAEVLRLSSAVEDLSLTNIDRVLDKLAYLEWNLGPRIAVVWSTLPGLQAAIADLEKSLMEAMGNAMDASFSARDSLKATSIAMYAGDHLTALREIVDAVQYR